MQQCGDCLKVYDESEFTHCPYCDDGPKTASCPECFGSGSVECWNCEGEGIDEDTGESCTECNGTGDLVCGDCG